MTTEPPENNRMRRIIVPMRGQPIDPYAYEVYATLSPEELRVLAARLSFMAASDTNVICDLATRAGLNEKQLMRLMHEHNDALERELGAERELAH